MMFFLILISIALLGVMVYFALDKKSSFKMRLAALGAIAIMILTVIICVIIGFSDKKVLIEDPSMLIVGEPLEIQDEGNSLLAIIFSILFLLALFTVIVVLVMREHKKHDKG